MRVWDVIKRDETQKAAIWGWGKDTISTASFDWEAIGPGPGAVCVWGRVTKDPWDGVPDAYFKSEYLEASGFRRGSPPASILSAATIDVIPPLLTESLISIRNRPCGPGLAPAVKPARRIG